MTNQNPSDDKMQNRINNIFANQVLPAHASLKDVEAMKNRIQELEANLKLQEQKTEMAEQEASQNKPQMTNSASSFTRAPVDFTPIKQSWLMTFWSRFVNAHPSITNIREQSSARLASSFLIVIFLLILAGGLAQIPQVGFVGSFTGPIMYSAVPTLLAYFLSRTKWYRGGVFIFSLMFGSLSYLSIITQGTEADVSNLILTYVPLSLIVASSFLSSWAVFLLIGLNVAFLYFTTQTGAVYLTTNVGGQAGLITTMGLILILLTNFRKRTEQQSLQEIKIANYDFKIANKELMLSRSQMEQRVHDRTRDLELASEIGRTITAKVDNLYQLLLDAVEQISSRFNLYYTQVYLTDWTGRTIVLRAGTGEVGKKLLQRGHQLLISSDSLNGRAALEKHTIIVADTLNNRTFLPNPLLPKTRSEMAVPLMIRDQVIGVLDMQSDKANALNESNLAAFEALAGQLAVAIQNANLFEQAHQARAEVLEQAKKLSLSGWDTFLNAVERGEKIGYTYNQNEILPYHNTSKTDGEINILNAPIQVAGADIGKIQIVDAVNREWTVTEKELISNTAQQLANHIENLRLLAQSEKYRLDAEQISKRLTRESWNEYFNLKENVFTGYTYNNNKVEPINENSGINEATFKTHPIYLHDDQIGELEIESPQDTSFDITEIISAVTRQLGSHIENLRLLEQAELSRVEVQKSQEQYNLAVAGSNDGIWDWDIAKDSIYYSPRWKGMLGYEEHELTRGFVEWEELVHPEDRDRAVKALDDYLAQKIDEYDVEVRLKHKDGHYVWVRDRGKALRREDGTAYRMAGAHTDISERKRNEDLIAQRANQLEEAQTFLDSVVENLPTMVFVKDAEDLRFVRFNKAAEELTGFGRESLLSKNDHDFFSKEEADFFTSKDRQVLISGQILDIPEEQISTVHHGIRYLHTRKVPIYGTDGKAKYLLGVSEDITERKHDQEILAQRANQLETVATVSTTASTVLNPDALLQQVVNLTKSRFNLYHAHVYLLDENWNTLLLAAGADEVGAKMVETGHAIDINAEQSFVARSARTKQAVIVNDVRNDEGFLPNASLPNTRAEMAIPMIVGDKVLGVFDVQSDTVDVFSREDANIYSTLASQVAVALQNARLYQEQSATVTQLRELDRLKSSFLANMSHELRTPLNSILGFTDVMLEGLDGPLTPNMDNDLKLINKNGQHLLHLINDVLDMAKIESGKLNLIIEKFNLHEIFEDVINITSQLASEKKLMLKVETKSDHDIEVNADRTRLRQVMINLINNALKFTEKGKVTIRAIREENSVLISVKDTGIGIPPEHLEAVFSEFTQVDSSTTRKAGGTGLGLPISRKLIEMHGGKLWAESNGVDGEGSTFFVFMPIESRSAVSEPVTRKL